MVIGVNDNVQDGDVFYYIVLKKVVLVDVSYNGFDFSDVVIVNCDDDYVGIMVFFIVGFEIMEVGGQVFYMVVLNSQLIVNVVVILFLNMLLEGVVLLLVLMFILQNWNVVQMVIVKGVDDQFIDGDVIYKVQGSVSSIDFNYN